VRSERRKEVRNAECGVWSERRKEVRSAEFGVRSERRKEVRRAECGVWSERQDSEARRDEATKARRERKKRGARHWAFVIRAFSMAIGAWSLVIRGWIADRADVGRCKAGARPGLLAESRGPLRPEGGAV
jgi:hypothetical protein